ncbi:MAG: glycosyltransferase family 2 protein [Lentisphaeria bacterium]|nr:glycosyltransferase family 2 protein [Lentisphaeria bacterium]
MTVRDIEKYRRRHPAPALRIPSGCRVCAVIPCYNENACIGETLSSLKIAAGRAPFSTSVLLVVNFPRGEDPAESSKLLKRLESGEFGFENLLFLYAPDLEGGVGAARKLGMDSFLQNLPCEAVPDALLFSLDADTTVEPDYFAETAEFLAGNKAGGVTIGYRHRTGETPEQEAAIRRYEAYLDRYVDRLEECGSPYAFHSVGSAFAVRGEAYIRCGGMKVRRAGEDFYFLQELAKTAGVARLPKVLVYPSPRLSCRTPFGTGRAVRELMEGKFLPEISDAAFARLRLLLAALSEDALDCDAPALPEDAFLQKERFFAVWPGVRRNTPPGRRLRAFHVWFDGLKTLRFLHFCDA